MKASKKRATTRKRATNPGAEGAGATRDLDVAVDALADKIAPLVRQLQALQEEARRLGMFTNERELLSCPSCGLTEDVLANGLLITNVDVGEPDTGLRFLEPATDDAPFVCPACGAEVRAQPE